MEDDSTKQLKVLRKELKGYEKEFEEQQGRPAKRADKSKQWRALEKKYKDSAGAVAKFQDSAKLSEVSTERDTKASAEGGGLRTVDPKLKSQLANELPISDERADQLRSIFYYCDADRDGLVSMDELKKALIYAFSSSFNTQDATSKVEDLLLPMFQEVDQQIDQVEFFKLFDRPGEAEGFLMARGTSLINSGGDGALGNSEDMLRDTLQSQLLKSLTGFDMQGFIFYCFCFLSLPISLPLLWIRHRGGFKNRLILFWAATAYPEKEVEKLAGQFTLSFTFYLIVWLASAIPMLMWSAFKTPYVAVQEALLPLFLYMQTIIIVSVILCVAEQKGGTQRDTLIGLLPTLPVMISDIHISTVSDVVQLIDRRRLAWESETRTKRGVATVCTYVFSLPCAIMPMAIRATNSSDATLVMVLGGSEWYCWAISISYVIVALTIFSKLMSMLNQGIMALWGRLAVLKFFTSLTDKNKGRYHNVPYLSLHYPQNVNAWLRLTEYYQGEGALQLRWIEIVVSGLVLSWVGMIVLSVLLHIADAGITRKDPTAASVLLDNLVFVTLGLYTFTILTAYLLILVVLGYTFNESKWQSHDLLLNAQLEIQLQIQSHPTADRTLREASGILDHVIPVVRYSKAGFAILGIRVDGFFMKSLAAMAILAIAFALLNLQDSAESQGETFDSAALAAASIRSRMLGMSPWNDWDL